MQFQTLQWVMDINADGSLSLWEIWETIRWVFRMPGSLVVEAIGQFPALAALLNISASPETGYASLNGLLAKGLSLLFWLPVLFWVLNLGSGPAKEKAPKAKSKETPLLLGLSDDYPVKHRH